MNQLSQLLYAGNVAGNLGGFFVFFGILTLIYTIVCFIASFICDTEGSRYSDDEERARNMKFARNARRLALPGFVFTFLLWTAAAFMPSQDTVYAIAASEMGESALKSETGSLATQALNSWLKEQITPAAPTP